LGCAVALIGIQCHGFGGLMSLKHTSAAPGNVRWGASRLPMVAV
jgi:hypothetical protein